jgi:signal transduction histidine kinase
MTIGRGLRASLRRVSPRSQRPETLDQLVDVVERDRAAIAARLHDGPVQTLTAASLRLQSAVHFDELTPAVAREVAAGIGEAAIELRGLMSGLVAWEVGSSTLEDTLRGRVEDACAAAGVEARLRLESSPAFVEEADALILRVAQDAVADAIQHAGATELEIALGVDESQVVLELRHDGTAADPSRRLGLVLLGRRAESAGARVEIDAGPGGTAISLVVPLDPA